MQAAAVILAAGASTRFGSPKQLARFGSHTMLERVVEIAREAGLAPIIAVVPPGLAVPSHATAEINADPAAGIGRSIRLGLAAVPRDVDAAVILLGDEPMLSAAVIGEVLAAAAAGAAAIVAARAGDRVGPPVLLRRPQFALADALEGDDGLNRVIRAHPDVMVIELPLAPVDVDTPADLEALAEELDR
jgi:CTP:molybdopterin cytidylyltransferase MocA